MVDNMEQRTLSWYRARLGNITGSQVGLLMKSGRNEIFSETAKSYIYQLAAERSMAPDIINDDTLFEMYLSQVEVTSKAIRFGTEQEENARNLFARIYDVNVHETGSCKHPSIPHFASSPDGFYVDENTGEKVCLEIKCPNQATFMRYKEEISRNSDLLRAKPEYFYQCMAHMMCCEASKTVFISYNPFQKDPISCVDIFPDEKVFAEMKRRIGMANEIIEQLIDNE